MCGVIPTRSLHCCFVHALFTLCRWPVLTRFPLELVSVALGFQSHYFLFVCTVMRAAQRVRKSVLIRNPFTSGAKRMASPFPIFNYKACVFSTFEQQKWITDFYVICCDVYLMKSYFIINNVDLCKYVVCVCHLNDKSEIGIEANIVVSW